MKQCGQRKPAWRALQGHYEKIKDVHLRQLFADDPKRGERLTAEGAGLYLDYSKNRITDETIRLLSYNSPRSAGSLSGGTRCSQAKRSTQRKSGRCFTSHCARRGGRK